MKIGIAGYTGRVGQLLVQELQDNQWAGMDLTIGSSRKEPSTDPGFPVTQDPATLFKKSDAVIDFTTPDLTHNHALLAAEHKTALIVGTTGLNDDQERVLIEAGQSTRVVYAANMSVGVTLITALVEQAAASLDPSWDIEVFEVHHNQKADAPSGTALALGKSAAKGRDSNPESPTHSSARNTTSKEGNAFVFDREGKRIPGEIGFSVSRGGDVVGEHMVTFYGAGERIEIGHKATDRSLFAKGALRAARWVKDQPRGLYTMRDVLGL